MAERAQKTVEKSAREKIEAILAMPTCSVDDATEVLGAGRNLVYAAIKSGDIAAMKMGRKILVLTAPLRRKLNGEAA